MYAKIQVVGANGFIGRSIVSSLASANYTVEAVTRRKVSLPSRRVRAAYPSELHSSVPESCYQKTDADVVVFAAGRAHQMKDNADDPLAQFRTVNVDLALDYANAAKKAGVRRFIYISSIGVNGPGSENPYSEESVPAPADPYAVSKYEAEQALQKCFEGSGTDLVIVRPPLVYGPQAPGNFGTLAKLVSSGFPLPLGSIKNVRSFIYLENLADFIRVCVSHPKAGNQTFVVSDNDDVSTTDLLREMYSALGKKARLVPVPVSLLRLMARFIGKADAVDKLCCSLSVDSSKARTMLDWSPPYSLREGVFASMSLK